jgi:hypothetical protein
MNVLMNACFTVNFVPLSVTEVEGGGRLEDGRDRSSSVVDGESDCSVNHLQNQVIATTLSKYEVYNYEIVNSADEKQYQFYHLQNKVIAPTLSKYEK